MENNQVLAVVGGKQITNADVDAMIASMGQQGQAYRSEQGRAMILEELIAQTLLHGQEGRSLGLEGLSGQAEDLLFLQLFHIRGVV